MDAETLFNRLNQFDQCIQALTAEIKSIQEGNFDHCLSYVGSYYVAPEYQFLLADIDLPPLPNLDAIEKQALAANSHKGVSAVSSHAPVAPPSSNSGTGNDEKAPNPNHMVINPTHSVPNGLSVGNNQHTSPPMPNSGHPMAVSPRATQQAHGLNYSPAVTQTYSQSPQLSAQQQQQMQQYYHQLQQQRQLQQQLMQQQHQPLPQNQQSILQSNIGSHQNLSSGNTLPQIPSHATKDTADASSAKPMGLPASINTSGSSITQQQTTSHSLMQHSQQDQSNMLPSNRPIIQSHLSSMPSGMKLTPSIPGQLNHGLMQRQPLQHVPAQQPLMPVKPMTPSAQPSVQQQSQIPQSQLSQNQSQVQMPPVQQPVQQPGAGHPQGSTNPSDWSFAQQQQQQQRMDEMRAANIRMLAKAQTNHLIGFNVPLTGTIPSLVPNTVASGPPVGTSTTNPPGPNSWPSSFPNTTPSSTSNASIGAPAAAPSPAAAVSSSAVQNPAAAPNAAAVPTNSSVATAASSNPTEISSGNSSDLQIPIVSPASNDALDTTKSSGPSSTAVVVDLTATNSIAASTPAQIATPRATTTQPVSSPTGINSQQAADDDAAVTSSASKRRGRPPRRVREDGDDDVTDTDNKDDSHVEPVQAPLTPPVTTRRTRSRNH